MSSPLDDGVSPIPADHPRVRSLAMREQIAWGVAQGLVHPTGLAAHGRGEAWYYLLGEETTAPARVAIEAAAAAIVGATRPVISVNGNVAVLAPEGVRKLAEASGAKVEVNVFHAAPGRVERLIGHLEGSGLRNVLGRTRDARIPGLSSERAMCSSEGIGAADLVVVPLEDGDRCEALRSMGKSVVTVDLNPLSRTARTADVTIVDEVTACLPLVADACRRLHGQPSWVAKAPLKEFDNRKNLQATLDLIAGRLQGMYR